LVSLIFKLTHCGKQERSLWKRGNLQKRGNGDREKQRREKGGPEYLL